jgi:hypothetical protein
MPPLESYAQLKAPVAAPPVAPTLKPVAAVPVMVHVKKEPYQYRPLDATKSEIRILALQGCNDPSEPIRLEVLHVSLDMTTAESVRMRSEETTAFKPYTALSYCWGAPKFDGKVVLSGHEVSVTESLAAGLKRLRYGDGKKLATSGPDLTKIKEYYWIDQICESSANMSNPG